jgi:hypothetical protein
MHPLDNEMEPLEGQPQAEVAQETAPALEEWVKPVFKSVSLEEAMGDPYGYLSGPTY